MQRSLVKFGLLAWLAVAGALSLPASAATLAFGWQQVDGVRLFYREGGPRDAPTLVLLHGNPLSSIMYVKLMEDLAATGAVHVIAVDYPSFGYSDAPDRRSYRYTFDHVADTVRAFLAARGVTRYALYMQDYGVPVGFRLMTAAPDAITAIVVQNGVIHLDGFPAAQDPDGELRHHWRSRNADLDRRRADYVKALTYPDGARWKKDDGASPDASLQMLAAEQRPGVIEARNDLWFDYGNNVARYPAWQALLRRLHVPVLVVWGSRDTYFTVPGALAYRRDAPQAEIHLLDADHFASLEVPDQIADLIEDFLVRHRLAAPAR